MSLGLANDPSLPAPGASLGPALYTNPGLVPSVGGILSMEGQSSIDARKAAAQEANSQPVIQNLAAHVRTQWSNVLQAKRMTVEDRMFKAMRQRRGEYDPEVLSEIQKGGGSEIYMMLTSNKCRAAASWIRDVMLGARDEKPWTIAPTPLPELPPTMNQSVLAIAQQEAQTFMQVTGQQPTPQDMEKIQGFVKDRIVANAQKRARETSDRMELHMEDQLVEGGFQRALGEFIEDIVTFPAAILKGPIVRRKKRMQWVPSSNGFDMQVEDKLVLEWARVDPFMVYPAAHASDIDDGDFIERHKLSRGALNELIGVEGYNENAIRTVLDEYGKGGLQEWLYVDSQKALVEGKSVAAISNNTDGLIDALQYWGSVQGKLLVEWGMDKSQVPDEEADYQCEVWLIGTWVIKATLNPDPLGRKPYFKASYEEIPGTFWGNAVTDLCRDTQTQCNNAARAIANNVGLGSGPQVVYNVDRLPAGEDLTQMYPWKVWQTTSDPYGATGQKTVDFFAPPMVAAELMSIYQFFSNLADDHTGVPRYMAGDAQGQGALRTSSGISMLMNNAGKAIKQVIANIDTSLKMLIERLWYYNMKYGDDPSLKGDICVVARGANSLVVKETQQQRINEFLQLALTNPIVNQIVGEEAIASLLRVAAKNLDMDTDSIVPPAEVIRARVFQMSQQQAAQQKAANDFQMSMALAPSHEVEMERGPDGEVIGMTVRDKQQHVMQPPYVPQGLGGAQTAAGGPQTMSSSGQTTGGAPVTDSFSPRRGA